MAQRKPIPGVDAKLLIKDAGEALARSDAAAVPARRRQPRRAGFAHRLRHHRRRYAEHALRMISRSTIAFRRCCSIRNKLAPKYPESTITRPFPFNAYYSQDEAPEVDGEHLPARDRRPGRQQEAVDARRTLQVAGGFADHAPCLRRRLERDRLLAGRALSDFLKLHRRRLPRQVCLVPLRRRLFEHHRHADRAASADTDDAQIRPPDPAARLRLPDQDPHSDQARLQEPEIRHRHGVRTTTPAAIGRTRATTGSADFEIGPRKTSANSGEQLRLSVIAGLYQA